MEQITAKEGLKRALDWLDANPDKHIRKALALSAATNGRWEVSPTDPKATCFCVIGRFAKEMGHISPENYWPSYTDYCEPLISEKVIEGAHDLWQINDKELLPLQAARDLIRERFLKNE